MELEHHQRVTCANCGRNYKNEKEHKRHLQRNRCRGQFGIMPVLPTLAAPSQSVVPTLAPPSQSDLADLAAQESPPDLGNNLE